MLIREPLRPSSNPLHVSIGLNALQYVRTRGCGIAAALCVQSRPALSPLLSSGANSHALRRAGKTLLQFAEPFIIHAYLQNPDPYINPSRPAHTTQASIELSTHIF
jgi:hypothetical protein